MTQALVGLRDIEAAAERIAGVVRRTPLLCTRLGRTDAPLFVKAECLQVGGSFKLRGATNAVALLSGEQRARGVITHSSGNHAQALARAARAAGIDATIVMPRQTPEVKRVATAEQGAEVVLVDISQRAAELERIQAQTGAVFVSPFDDAAVVAGQGTIGLEVLDDLPEVATVLVPVSGGGLISGIAAAIKATAPQVRIIGVEPELAGDLAEGFARGTRVTWDSADTGRTIADGLRVPTVGELTWRHITALVDDVVTVSEDAIRSAMRAVVLDAKVVAEPSGAVAVAGYLAHSDVVGPGPAVAIISGGNVEPALLRDVLAG
ncbi:MAG: threonine/serine dehydratase [Nocardioidaceae bacterium]|nr:threonine/serine dehydratase [Nocardioidaceae bacterium]